MGLVHEAEDHLLAGGILGRELAPEVCELSVGRSALTDNEGIDAGVVVEVNSTICAGCEAGLHQLVIGCEVRGVECAPYVVIGEILPRNSWEDLLVNIYVSI